MAETAEALVVAGDRRVAWTIHTDVFDGPLDLLLYLVKRDGIDLRRLSVARITDSYLAYLDRMRELNLSVAGDYLVMAATLVHLKSLELLPRLPAVLAEEEDPRAALAHRLAEYQRYKEAAEALELRPLQGRDVFTRAPLDPADAPDGPVEAGIDAFGLLDLYFDLLQREPARPPVFRPELPQVDFAATCRRVLDALRQLGDLDLGDWLRACAHRAERVIGFVAVLEMMRQHWLDVTQEAHLGPIRLTARVDLDAIDLTRVTGWVEASDVGA